ncbi:Gfo/Idh/MocA family protein [Chelativorans sp. YIM 93263]|uniref:Gfo/Idh/MocA family protein n=1 Tax=Chelativorans sp. YIM 93263 TaxID=2906648 RepID=UPI002377FE0A|nr:Gfo/Idh/MocA family oxidoreductase [Chelativorans sp. YIM 93263]
MSMVLSDSARARGLAKPRLGFLGAGWIGRHRMEAVLEAGVAEATAIAEPSEECMRAAADLSPSAKRVDTLEALFREDIDGIVIATPSALHAQQAVEALEQGMPVFCQKPLGRARSEVQAVVVAAEKADRLLGADFSYRHTEAMRRIRPVLSSGEIGQVHAVDLTFHNAYGPDKTWFYDPALSGGGCLIDLGVHLVDLALWALDFPEVVKVESHLFAEGEKLPPNPSVVEDFAVATLTLKTGTIIRLTCSWRLHAGQDAQISAAFYGTQGGLALRNVGGSFYDFRAERYRGTESETISEPPDDWGGRAIVDWARQLSRNPGFNPEAKRFVQVAEIIDRLYGRDLDARPD